MGTKQTTWGKNRETGKLVRVKCERPERDRYFYQLKVGPRGVYLPMRYRRATA